MTNWHTKPSVCGTFILPHQSWCMHQPRRKRSDFVDLTRLVWTLKHLIALTDSNSIWLICKLNKLPYYGCYCSTLQIHVSPAIDGLLLNWNTSEAQTSCLMGRCVRASAAVCEILNAIITLHQTGTPKHGDKTETRGHTSHIQSKFLFKCFSKKRTEIKLK